MIAKEIAEFIEVLTSGARGFGALEASGIWALFCMILVWIIWYDKKEAHRKDMADREIREAKSIAESKTADALYKLGDAYERLVDTHKAQIDIILSLKR